MSIYTDFYKFLLCLVLFCLCGILLLRLREKFEDDNLQKKIMLLFLQIIIKIN